MSMKQAVVWSQERCTYCDQAKALLASKGIVVEERQIGNNAKWSKKDLIDVVPNARSVPQIFLEGEHIGGFLELQTYFREQADV